MNKDKLLEMYNTYELSKEDFFKHQHYTIITRQGIDKIQAKAKIQINYEVIRCEPNYAVFKAIASKGAANIETFGSALKGDTYKDSTTNSFYIAEMAENRCTKNQSAAEQIDGITQTFVVSVKKTQNLEK